MVKSALIVVDMQNDFCEGGSLAVPGASSIIETVNRLIESPFFQQVIFTADCHPADHVSFASQHGLPPFQSIQLADGKQQELWPEHCVEGTWGQQIHQGVHYDIEKHPMIKKGTHQHIDSYSGFGSKGEHTGLQELLKQKGVERIYCVGLAFDFCVKSTAVDGMSIMPTYIISDGTVPIDEGGRAILEESLLAQGIQIRASSEII